MSRPHVYRRNPNCAYLFPEYQAWKGMRARCNNQKHAGWKYYGSKGIHVCQRWDSFRNFISDMGSRPDDRFTIERMDSGKDYCPENCKWADRTEQSHNSSKVHKVVFDGELLCIKDVWKRLNGAVKYQTLVDRINKGWSLERCVSPMLWQ